MGSGNRKIPVAVLGATGSVGQRFLTLLQAHPWFEVRALAASDASAGRPYAEAVRWLQAAPLPEAIGRLTVSRSAPPLEGEIVFSALDAAVAGPIEESFARAGALVVSNARNHRMDPEVPLVVPEVNAGHLDLLATQRFAPGGILTNPNCSTIGLVMALKPLADAFGVEQVQVVTLQALSGAGFPGVSSFEMVDNVIPYIAGEEEKVEQETSKILGRIEGKRIAPAALTVSAQCNRVPVLDGHTECVSVRLGRRATAAEVRAAWERFASAPQSLSLPSAPRRPIHYLDGEAFPQPRLHRDLEGGMAVSVGRLRPCPLLDYKFLALSHNTIRGAAGGAILLAELAVANGWLESIRKRAGAA